MFIQQAQLELQNDAAIKEAYEQVASRESLIDWAIVELSTAQGKQRLSCTERALEAFKGHPST
jgi:hypothetical protein